MFVQNKKNSFIESDYIFEIIIFFYLTISIFNFDNFFKLEILSIILLIYLVFFYVSNTNKFFSILNISFVFVFLFFWSIYQIYYYYNPHTVSKPNLLSLEFNKMIFCLALFSFMILLKKNWVIFLKDFYT